MKSNRYQVIALVGKSGAGKDSIAEVTCYRHSALFHRIVSSTTRPMREEEIDGLDYHFLGVNEFARVCVNGEMLETAEFKGWFYGTAMSALVKDKINLGVFSPTGVKQLLDNPNLDVLVIEITASNKTRLMRCLEREEAPDCTEICRRFLADEQDFKNLSEWEEFATISNENGDELDLLERVNGRFDQFRAMWANTNSEFSFSEAIRTI